MNTSLLTQTSLATSFIFFSFVHFLPPCFTLLIQPKLGPPSKCSVVHSSYHHFFCWVICTHAFLMTKPPQKTEVIPPRSLREILLVQDLPAVELSPTEERRLCGAIIEKFDSPPDHSQIVLNFGLAPWWFWSTQFDGYSLNWIVGPVGALPFLVHSCCYQYGSTTFPIATYCRLIDS